MESDSVHIRKCVLTNLNGEQFYLVSRALPPFRYAKYGLVTLVQRSLHDGVLMKIL